MSYDPKDAVDLSDIRNRADERDAAEARMEQASNEAYAQEWDAAMTRAFKGIMPTPERRAALLRRLRRGGAADA